MAKSPSNRQNINHIKKKTSQSSKKSSVKFSGMNKSKKSSFKTYRGQGK